MDVVKAYAHTVVAPAIDYWIKTIDIKKGDEVARLKTARIFNPLHVVVNKISVDDIDNLKLFKLSEHPQIGPHIQDMKSEINKYHALVQSIKSLDERKDVKGKDTFSLPEWWRCNSGSLPHFSFVLRALLTNARRLSSQARSLPSLSTRSSVARQIRPPRRVPWPSVGYTKNSLFCLSQPKSNPTLALRNVSSACSMPLLERIREVPSGTTLSWQCSRSTTNAISELLLFCVYVCVMRYIFISVLFSLGVRGVCVRCGYEDRIHFGRILEEL